MSAKATPAARVAKPKKAKIPTGVPEVDRLEALPDVTLADYVQGVSAYICASDKLTKGQSKSAQIRLSIAIGRALATALKARRNSFNLVVGERPVAGALRVVNADVSEVHQMDGLRFAIEIKPVNLAVGRAIWNRFGDVRTFAVNIHLKFPFAVVGGLMPIPLVDRAKKKKKGSESPEAVWLPVDHLIRRACARFERARGRRTEGDAAHLMEGMCVLAYDPRTCEIDPEIPKPGSGLRWDEFVEQLVSAYEARYADDADVAQSVAANEEEDDESSEAPELGLEG